MGEHPAPRCAGSRDRSGSRTGDSSARAGRAATVGRLGGVGQKRGKPREDAQLVPGFGATGRIRGAAIWNALRAEWTKAHIVGCSTAGEIAGTVVRDDSLVATALQFASSRAHALNVQLRDVDGSR